MRGAAAAPRRPVAIALSILLGGIACVLGGIGCVTPIRISIAQARERLASLRGGLVRVDGTVRRFTDAGGDYYVLEDEDRNRIGLTGSIAPLLPPLADHACRVTGALGYRSDGGFFLEGHEVERL